MGLSKQQLIRNCLYRSLGGEVVYLGVYVDDIVVPVRTG